MSKPVVAVVRYEKPQESVRKAVELSAGLQALPSRARVFIKPNIVCWTKSVPFPKWGVITTSRVVEDMVFLLREHGIEDITIGEGSVLSDPKDRETPAHAFESLGYTTLARRYGVKVYDLHQRPFEKVSLGDGIELNYNTDILQSDFVVNIPVVKTHAQTVVSLGIKNLKGVIDMNSRKKCHSPDPACDLNARIARLANPIPLSFTILDGIYTNERGPAFDGKIRRSNLLVASADLLSADKVGSRLLGYEPSKVPHLVHAARYSGRTTDLSDLQVVGEKLEDVAMKLEYSFAYNKSNTLPLPMEKLGIKGLSYPKYDLSLCTYCSSLQGIILTAIAHAWKGEPWDDVEILTGKMMEPSPTAKKTVLIGKCLSQAHRSHPRKDDFIMVKSCPPSPQKIVEALHQAGIEVSPQIFEHVGQAPGFFMQRYQDKPEFEESLFTIA
jgi:uncharacterized protein (DUF362 family)